MKKLPNRSTPGHYDEISKIHQFRNGTFSHMQEQVAEKRRSQEAVRRQAFSAADLRRTTIRKSPSGHH